MNQLQVTIEKRISPALFNVFGCVGFWNEQGEKVYNENKAGRMGGQYSQEQARKLSYQDFALASLNNELNTVINENEEVSKEYKAGKGGSHLWVARVKDNERVLIITIP